MTSRWETRLRTMLLLLALLLTTCPSQAETIEKGVPKTLAQARAERLSAIQYDLSFHIPRTASEPVKGQLTLSFSTKAKADVVLDFTGKIDPDRKTPCRVNGKPYKARVENEHIVIPRRLIRANNEVELSFVATDQALNRRPDYMYTLFVPDHARTAFPCFDQPDLKARFRLSLTIPADWTCETNSPVIRSHAAGDEAVYATSWSQPLPTYLFAFNAGVFKGGGTFRQGSRTITLVSRETDEYKHAQCPEISRLCALAIDWMERYTGIAMPFPDYRAIILPDYQFGGMEHPGCIQLNEKTIFLEPNATIDDELKRFQLIAHETAHLWFGDLVTMRWFDDVWTKEVFANFFADKMAREQFPKLNHDLNFLKSHYPFALAIDRTEGSHPIQQPLANLNSAGLLYGNIIYHKAPIMMRQLEERMGEGPFRLGLQRYLHRFSYANATWNDLIGLLDSIAPQAGLPEFSRVWVQEKGCPEINITSGDGQIFVDQRDPNGHGLLWPQQFKIGLLGTGSTAELTFETEKLHEPIPYDAEGKLLVPNYDGLGYGQFLVDSLQAQSIGRNLPALPDLNRYAAAMTLYENWLLGRIVDGQWLFGELLRQLRVEQNPLVASALCGYLQTINFRSAKTLRQAGERQLLDASRRHPLPLVRQRLLHGLSATATDHSVIDKLYTYWHDRSEPLLSERDLMRLSYHLALMRPNDWQAIVGEERQRLTNVDMQREYDFVSLACNPDTTVQRQLFNRLLTADNRRTETWVADQLSLLCDYSRGARATGYILPALDALIDVQQTSSIFFPGNWLSSLLSGNQTTEARVVLRSWIARQHDYPASLMNKVKQEGYFLLKP